MLVFNASARCLRGSSKRCHTRKSGGCSAGQPELSLRCPGREEMHENPPEHPTLSSVLALEIPTGYMRPFVGVGGPTHNREGLPARAEGSAASPSKMTAGTSPHGPSLAKVSKAPHPTDQGDNPGHVQTLEGAGRGLVGSLSRSAVGQTQHGRPITQRQRNKPKISSSRPVATCKCLAHRRRFTNAYGKNTTQNPELYSQPPRFPL